MRPRDIIAVIALIIVAVAGQLMRGGGETEQPRPPSQENPRRPDPQRFEGAPWDAETRAWLEERPTESEGAPGWLGVPSESLVDVPSRRSSGSGTAFAIGPGTWLTARHVIDGCDRVGLQYAPRKAIKVTDITPHESADVALLRTRDAPQAFSIKDQSGEAVYMVGFPAGAPGAVHGRRIGTTTLRERGRYKTREKADVWSERSRIPDRDGSLGGLSGGPAFDGDGRVFGVVLAEDRRRGRVITAQPATLRALIRDAGARTGDDPSPGGFTPDGYPKTARELLLSLRVARVLCQVR